MKIEIGFGCTIEKIEGETHTSLALRNDEAKRATKLGRIKNHGKEKSNR